MDLKELKRLIELVEAANISHFSIEEGGTKIKIEKELTAVNSVSNVVLTQPAHLPSAVPPVMAQAPAAPVVDEVAQENEGLVPITAQMVGTFYSAPKPESPVFVKVGDTISKGQTLCIIEAMKLFNEIESEVEGTIEKICVKNGDPIEFGQVLFLLRP